MTDQNDLQFARDELLEAIVYFVKRQTLVAQAISDFGLDLNAIAILGAFGWTLGYEDAEKVLTTPSDNLNTEFKKALQALVKNKIPRAKQSGLWQDKYGQKWKYFLHGGGCQIINQDTSEIIDWDCPNTYNFDRFKFLLHLEWQLQQDVSKYINLRKLMDKYGEEIITNRLIPDLVDEGKILLDAANQYRIS